MFISPVADASILAGAYFTSFFLLFWKIVYKGQSSFFFNPQDYANSKPPKNLPESSKTATFDPFITQYTGMAKVMIGLAAASISFGGVNPDAPYIFTAKILLAYSIAFALLFSIVAINFYENYLHDLDSYIPPKIALVEASGITAMFCFALGYGYWALHL